MVCSVKLASFRFTKIALTMVPNTEMAYQNVRNVIDEFSFTNTSEKNLNITQVIRASDIDTFCDTLTTSLNLPDASLNEAIKADIKRQLELPATSEEDEPTIFDGPSTDNKSFNLFQISAIPSEDHIWITHRKMSRSWNIQDNHPEPTRERMHMYFSTKASLEIAEENSRKRENCMQLL